MRVYSPEVWRSLLALLVFATETPNHGRLCVIALADPLRFPELLEKWLSPDPLWWCRHVFRAVSEERMVRLQDRFLPSGT